MICKKSIALLALIALLLTGCAQNPQEQTSPDTSAPTGHTETQPSDSGLTVESVEQEGELMVITTSYCVLKYPFAFSDLIRVTAENQEDQASLLFCAWLSNTEYPMYSLIFDGDEGVPVGQLTLEDGTTVSVTVQFFQADEDMEPDMQQSFYAVQETINDIIGSLADVEGFTAAQ